ncbi:MAG: shikimate kinase [Clostridia bacterium]|nr:shikimate kinase [Clostridia bacterium]
MKKDNVILIGMPGCGKSTLGIVAAKMLCMDFVDVDLIIQKKIEMSLQEYIDRYGVDAFLKVEAETVCELDMSNTVIATGGSAVLREEAAEHLTRLGHIVYLRLPCEEIEHRVTNLSRRGVAMRAGESLRDVYNLRAPIYEKYADLTLDIDGNDIAENCRILTELIKKANINA